MGAVWALLGAFLTFLARSGALLGRLLGFMGASDLIWGGFGQGLGGIWRGFGEGFAKVLEDFWKIYFDFLKGVTSVKNHQMYIDIRTTGQFCNSSLRTFETNSWKNEKL